MKAGDKVKITDTSYTKCVNGRGEIIEPSACKTHKLPAILVAKDCVLPGQDYAGLRNNAIVQICDTKQLVFIDIKQLTFLEHTITIDGKEITISDKSYQELKRSLT